MSTLSSTVLLVLIAALAAPAMQEPQPLVRDPLRLIDGGTTVELQLDLVPLEDFLQAAQALLGVPIQYSPGVVSNIFLNVQGAQRVPLAEFRDTFDALLRRYEFWTWDDTSGPGPVILVFKVSWDTRYGAYRLPFTPPVLGADELSDRPRIRSPLYTTTFTLQHVAAIDLVVVVQPMLDKIVGKVRHVEASNQLLVTASRENLIAVRDVLAQMDVPGPQSPGIEMQLSAVNQRLADLETRLASLESKAGG